MYIEIRAFDPVWKESLQTSFIWLVIHVTVWSSIPCIPTAVDDISSTQPPGIFLYLHLEKHEPCVLLVSFIMVSVQCSQVGEYSHFHIPMPGLSI